MDFEFTKEEQAFRAEAAAFIAEHAATPGVRHDNNYGTRYVDTAPRRQFMKELAKKGYLGMCWPKEYGGRGMSEVYDYLLNEELAVQGLASTGKGVGTIGRTFILRGTDEQKKKFLPQILKGEIEWAIGYTEPDSGSDLASLKLKAVREEGGWRINGQKRFTSSAHFADWYFFAARTSSDGPKHQGVTLFILEMNAPGLTVNPMMCMDGERTNEVFFDDVFVPDNQVLGELGKGFQYISQALDFERHIMLSFGIFQRMYNLYLDWVKTATRDGKPVSKDPAVRKTLARLTMKLEMGRLLNLKVVATKDPQQASITSAMNKLYLSEFAHAVSNGALDTMGPGSWLALGDPDAPADGVFEQIRRTAILLTVGGGTSEIQRNIIARRGLGLPNPT
ncbi:MAG: acyl-CoA dehydrogenase family protein [Rhodocyclaceae bacterium]|nr:acyl-CoA dehydrogenase family protein [Rhodocyclaceae bacterium]